MNSSGAAPSATTGTEGLHPTERTLPLVLGWGNPERDAEQMRLYSLDAGPAPRWLENRVGRVAEQGIREQGPGTEGDRYLLVRVSSRFASDDEMRAAAAAIEQVLP